MTTPPQPEARGWRAHGQRALIYFGLAEEPGAADAPETARRADWHLIAFTPVLFALLVGARRGTVAGLITFAAFLPGSIIAALIAFDRVDERHAQFADSLAIIPLTVSATLLVSSRHTPVSTIVAIDVAVLAVLFVARFTTRRRAATRAAGRRTRT